MKLEGAVSVVTGAGSGLGAALIHQLAEAGVVPVVIDLRPERVQKTVDAADVTVPRDALRESADNPEAVYIDPALDRDRTVAWFYTPITGLVKR